MATLPSPHTWAVGETPTAVQLNTDLRDNWGFFANRPRVKVYNSTGQSISGDTLLTWDTEIYDSDGMHSGTNASRLIAVTAGAYQVDLHINWEIINNASPGNRYAGVRLNQAGDSDLDLNLTTQYGNDAVLITTSDTSGCPQTSHVSFQMLLSANDYLEASCGISAVTANSIVAGAADRTWFGMRWIGAS